MSSLLRRIVCEYSTKLSTLNYYRLCKFSSKVNYKTVVQNEKNQIFDNKINTDHLKNEEIPTTKGLPIFGTLFSLIKAGGSPNLHLYIDSRHEQLGPIFKESIGPVEAVFVCDPQIMRKIYSVEGKYPIHILPEAWLMYNKIYGTKRGLYFMDGEEWLHHRRILNNIFLSNYENKSLIDVQKVVINDWIDMNWRPFINSDIVINERMFYQLSLTYIVAALLGDNYVKFKHKFINDIVSLSNYVHSIFEESYKLNLIPAKWAVALNLPPWKRFTVAVNNALKEGESMVNQMIELCSDNGIMKKLLNENIPKEIVIRIVVDLILAASDTTGFTSQWSVYLLSRHPEIQQSMIDQCSNDDYNNQLVRGIIKETLRLYPAAPFITRVLPDDVTLGGYHIKAGQLLIMSLYTSGRNAKYFLEPEKFWPERWERINNNFITNEEVSSDNLNSLQKDFSSNRSNFRGVIEPNASQPFAMGLRSCIGKKLAESQMGNTLNAIVSNFHLTSLEETEMTLHFVPVPKTPIKLHVSDNK